jgi:hypothetical protein
MKNPGEPGFPDLNGGSGHEPITERTMVQAGAVMTTQKGKELIYVLRLENPST